MEVGHSTGLGLVAPTERAPARGQGASILVRSNWVRSTTISIIDHAVAGKNVPRGSIATLTTGSIMIDPPPSRIA